MKRIFFFLSLAVVLSFSCKGKPKEEERVPEASQEIKKVTLRETRFGKTLWIMEADRLEEREDTTWVYSLKIEFVKKGKKTSTLTGDSGLYIPRTGDMTAFGDVSVRTEEGARLWTSELKWQAEKEEIFTDKEVLIKKKGKTIKGKGLISDPELKNIVIQGKVEGYE